MEQIQHAHLIVANKIDLLTEDEDCDCNNANSRY